MTPDEIARARKLAIWLRKESEYTRSEIMWKDAKLVDDLCEEIERLRGRMGHINHAVNAVIPAAVPTGSALVTLDFLRPLERLSDP